MRIRPTPWYPASRVFEVQKQDVEALVKIGGEGISVSNINAGSINFAAKCGNEIINNLIKGSRGKCLKKK